MSSQTVVGVLVVVFVLAFALAKYWQSGAERWWNRAVFFRRLGSSAIMILLAATFIQSGNPLLIGVTVVLVILVALFVAVEEPHKEVV